MTALSMAIDSIGDYLNCEQRPRWRSNVWMIALLVIVISSIASSLSYTAAADRDISRQFDAKLAAYRGEAERITSAERIKNQSICLATQAAFDASLVDAIPRSRALAEVANAAPVGIRILDIALAAQADAAVLQISAIAASDAQVSQFVNALGKSPLLHDVRLLPRNGNLKFSITANFAQ